MFDPTGEIAAVFREGRSNSVGEKCVGQRPHESDAPRNQDNKQNIEAGHFGDSALAQKQIISDLVTQAICASGLLQARTPFRTHFDGGLNMRNSGIPIACIGYLA